MMRQPRISAAAATGRPLHLAITWADRTTSIVDLTGLVSELKVFEPLDNPDTFENVRADQSGWSIKWNDEIDLGADTLWRLALEQRGDAMRVSDFNAWRKRNKLTLDTAAAVLGLSRRVVAYYAMGRRIIPKIVMLATKGYELSQPESQHISTGSTAVFVIEPHLFRIVTRAGQKTTIEHGEMSLATKVAAMQSSPPPQAAL